MSKDLDAAAILKTEYEYDRLRHEEMMRSYPAVMLPPGAIYQSPYGEVRTPQRLPSNHEMLCMRMRWDPRGNIVAFDHIAVHSAGDKVFVWVITKDAQAVTIEDDAALYPSDALVTKLRMMQQ